MLWWRSAGQPEDPDAPPVDELAELVPASSRAIRAAVAGRIKGYTPDWSAGVDGGAGADAGVALVKVFAEQASPVFAQSNRLREKFRREQLRMADVQGRGPSVGRVTVVFTLLDTAQQSVPIPPATQLTAPGADGAGQVVFETTRQLFATAAQLSVVAVETGILAVRFAPGEVTAQSPLSVFGRRPEPGSALWLGLTGPVPYPRIALLFDVVGRDEPERTSGAPGDPAMTDEPVLQWDLLTREGLVPAEVNLDGTRGLRQAGIVEISTTRDWPARRHPVLAPQQGDPPIRWLRASLLHGSYDVAPLLASLRLNAVVAEGAETLRDEILEPVEDLRDTQAQRFRLSRAPVLPGTVRIVVDAPDPADLFDIAPESESADRLSEWTEVSSLATSRPYDRHFVLDEMTGVVTFGDGVLGAAVPPGFRHVRATSYRTGGGRATAVPASAGFVPRGAVPFLAGVDNPAPAAGGADAEDVDDLLARGPDLLRARHRAVTPADVETVARVSGGGVGRVIALSASDVDGTVRPGQLTLLVLGAAGGGGPPVPTPQTLDAVAAFFTDPRKPLVPLGTRVVVRTPRFVQVDLEVALQFDPEGDATALVLAVTRAINGYLDPLAGGENKQGWPLGAAINYLRLVAVIAGVEGVTSVSRVAVLVDGRSSAPCRDAPLPPFTLPWPGQHLVVPSSRR